MSYSFTYKWGKITTKRIYSFGWTVSTVCLWNTKKSDNNKQYIYILQPTDQPNIYSCMVKQFHCHHHYCPLVSDSTKLYTFDRGDFQRVFEKCNILSHWPNISKKWNKMRLTQKTKLYSISWYFSLRFPRISHLTSLQLLLSHFFFFSFPFCEFSKWVMYAWNNRNDAIALYHYIQTHTCSLSVFFSITRFSQLTYLHSQITCLHLWKATGIWLERNTKRKFNLNRKL